MNNRSIVHYVSALLLILSAWPAAAAEGVVAIRIDFPGGNVLVEKNEAGTVRLAPDLRGGPPWFYWHFEAEAVKPGSVTFSFGKPPLIGSRGPAVSKDGGLSWEWLGADKVQYAPPATKEKTARSDSFAYTFSEAGQKVRFAVAMPYLHKNLSDFLTKNSGNSHLKRSELTKSRLGKRSVDLLQIGTPGEDRRAVLLTARHHACESMASYVLEGFLQEAMSDSQAGIEFRKKYVLYAVPIVDRDGVEDGDQGKNRLPRDYNRDYGVESIYPEIKAIQELAELRKIDLSLDLHCPFLRGDIHDAFYFLGLGLPHIKDNLKELTSWLKEERPQIAMTPVDLVDPKKAGSPDPSINSHHFALRKNAIFAATLEVPYTQPACPLDAAMARAYGAGLLKAWARTTFVAANTKREGDDHEKLADVRTRFIKLYKSKPMEAEQIANALLESKTVASVYQVEAKYLLALLRLYQKKYADAINLCDQCADDPGATVSQKAAAAVLRVRVASANPKATDGEVEAALVPWRRLTYPSLETQTQALAAVSEFYSARQDHEKALRYTREHLAAAPNYEKGKLLNRIASAQDALKRPEDALATRKGAVAFLRARLEPKPERSIFGARMTFDLYEAIIAIPTTSLEDKKAAAQAVLDHEITSVEMKTIARKALAGFEK